MKCYIYFQVKLQCKIISCLFLSGISVLTNVMFIAKWNFSVKKMCLVLFGTSLLKMSCLLLGGTSVLVSTRSTCHQVGDHPMHMIVMMIMVTKKDTVFQCFQVFQVVYIVFFFASQPSVRCRLTVITLLLPSILSYLLTLLPHMSHLSLNVFSLYFDWLGLFLVFFPEDWFMVG